MTPKTKLPAKVFLYFFCQSINLTSAVISVAVSASVGLIIAPSSSLATLPYGMQFLFLLIATYPASVIMEKYGRRFGFILGAIMLLLSGLTGFYSVSNKSFIGLLITHSLLGLYIACANYYRFAVTDGLAASLKSKALSLVVAGGVVAGVIGPTISAFLKDINGFAMFSLSYGFFVVLAITNFILLIFLPDSQLPKTTETKISARKNHTNPEIRIAILSAALGYGLMNLLMIESSLQMKHLNIHFNQASIAIQWHVVAMFLPSFFSGYLISKFGHLKIIICGFMLFLVTFFVNVLGDGYVFIVISLISLGLAWNLSYIAGSAMLVSSVKNDNANKWQGYGDTIVAILAMLGAMLPSFLFSYLGWTVSNYLSIAIVAASLAFIISQRDRINGKSNKDIQSA